jgi:hypothetical protein
MTMRELMNDELDNVSGGGSSDLVLAPLRPK